MFVKNLLAIPFMTRCFIWVLLVLLSLPARAELEVFTLRHRNAEDVLPVVRTLLEPDGTASALDAQLIVRTSPHNLEEIRRVLPALDTPLRRLKITVLQDIDSETAHRMLGTSANFGAGNARISTDGAQGGPGGAVISVERGTDRLAVQGNVMQGRESDRQVQTVRVVEGGRARIVIGKTMPVVRRQTLQSAGQTQVFETTQFREANSGFYVVPRVNGDRVTLEIDAQNERFSPNATDGNAQIQQVHTTVSGRLGEWLSLGEVGEQNQQESRSISSAGTSRLREQRSILLRVEAE